MSSVRCEQLSLPRPQEISALLSTQLGIFMIQAKDSIFFSENLTRLSLPVPLQSTQLNRRFLSSTCCQECRVRENKCSTRCPRAWALSAIIVWAVGTPIAYSRQRSIRLCGPLLSNWRDAHPRQSASHYIWGLSIQRCLHRFPSPGSIRTIAAIFSIGAALSR